MAMAAITGPAHGTYTAPSARPRTNGPPALDGSGCGSRVNGCCRTRCTAGTTRPSPARNSTISPAQRSTPAGRCSAVTSSDPVRVSTAKLSTRPATIRTAPPRRATATVPTVPSPPGSWPGIPGLVVMLPAPKKTAGSTGSTQGDTAVTAPASTPISSRVNTIRHTARCPWLLPSLPEAPVRGRNSYEMRVVSPCGAVPGRLSGSGAAADSALVLENCLQPDQVLVGSLCASTPP